MARSQPVRSSALWNPPSLETRRRARRSGLRASPRRWKARLCKMAGCGRLHQSRLGRRHPGRTDREQRRFTRDPSSRTWESHPRATYRYAGDRYHRSLRCRRPNGWHGTYACPQKSLDAANVLRGFLFDRVYYPLNRTGRHTVEAQGVVLELCDYYSGHFDEMPEEYQPQTRRRFPPERVVADYVASMTDQLRDRSISESSSFPELLVGVTIMDVHHVNGMQSNIRDRLDIVDLSTARRRSRRRVAASRVSVHFIRKKRPHSWCFLIHRIFTALGAERGVIFSPSTWRSRQVDFREALTELAQRAGVETRNHSTGSRPEQEERIAHVAASTSWPRPSSTMSCSISRPAKSVETIWQRNVDSITRSLRDSGSVLRPTPGIIC